MGSFYPVIKTIDETRRRFVVLSTFYVNVFHSITIITIITIIVTRVLFCLFTRTVITIIIISIDTIAGTIIP